MNLANKLTFVRIVLSPVFFIVYSLPADNARMIIVSLWLIFVISQITDLLDGMAARKCNEVSDFGKFFDPFADTLMQLTCFLCFVIDGIFPAFLFLIIIYREFSILFIRNIMLKNGISLGASLMGKIKTVAYIAAGGLALLTVSFQRMSAYESIVNTIKTIALVILIISIVFSVASFIHYFILFRKSGKNTQGKSE